MNLEKEPICESQRLFDHELQNGFFEQLMWGSSWCLKALNALEQVVRAKPLLNKLLLQMDNCVKENKNKHLFVFLSLLTMKEVLAICQRNWENKINVLIDLMKMFITRRNLVLFHYPNSLGF